MELIDLAELDKDVEWLREARKVSQEWIDYYEQYPEDFEAKETAGDVYHHREQIERFNSMEKVLLIYRSIIAEVEGEYRT